MPLSRVFSSPKDNVNWVYGLGSKPQKKVPAMVYLLFIMVGFPLLIYLPTHLILLAVFRGTPVR